MPEPTRPVPAKGRRCSVLCYGDSNTWGSVPGSEYARFGPDVRWPRVMASALGDGFEVHEAGLGGRTTAFDLLPWSWRSGTQLLVPTMETTAPLDLVVILLGTNDVSLPHLTVPDIVRGAGELVTIVRSCGDLGPTPGQAPVPLLVAPHVIGPLGADDEPRSIGAPERSCALGPALREWAKRSGCAFADLAGVVEASPDDPWHWEPAGHGAAAAAIGAAVRSTLESRSSQT